MDQLTDKWKKKILVSHSGRQYVHRLLTALKLGGHPFDFFTSFAFLPEKYPFRLIRALPSHLRSKVEKELRKRSFSGIDAGSIRQLPWFELLREISDKVFKNRIAEKMLYHRDRIHDRWVASRLTKDKYRLVIGYEECCSLTFEKAKKLGMITVLDLAQIHYQSIEKISRCFPYFSDIYKNQKLRNKINQIKEEELQLSDYIICLSTFAKASLVAHGFAEDKIFVVNLGFDPEVFTPKQKYSIEGPLKIVFSGTLTKRKGIDQLLQLKIDLGDAILLTLVGPMADASDLLSMHAGKFVWHEYLEQQDMCEVLQASDLFVFPSYLDSWAMVVLEAMACGLPVIISEHTGAKDAVNGQEGYIVEAGNYDQFKQKVTLFVKDRTLLETMGRNAAENSKHYYWSNYYKMLSTIITQIQAD